MNEQKHTPGPWEARFFEDDEEYAICVSADIGYRGIATVSVGFTDEVDAEQHANAALTAAAPDMLAALERTVEIYEDEAPIMAADLKAVIAKAKVQDNS